MNQTRTQLLFAGALVIFAIATRVIFNALHVYNFNAVMAAGLFAGAYLGSRRMGFVIPLLAMLATDVAIGFYDWRLMAFVYASIGLAFVIGRFYAKDRTLPRFVGSVLGGSALFFLVTNGAVWLLAEGAIYPKTIAGLAECYTAGLPFYRNTLLGDLLWSTVLFGSYELLRLKAPKRVAITQ
ncbi:MAG TPA: DUF6580 family putative transport protein [Candidatus Kapabacteria bacterium]|nr:DUF6580 family putative transport protein [Candidatus Kapabacteria bacterium]